jgi:murein L,D-transpeptidase YcbB/YkuD
VLARLAAIQGGHGGNGGVGDSAPAPPLLKIGFRGPEVTKLKVDLKAWFDVNAPGQWRTFGVDNSTVFGDALAQAVREFQRRNGLEVDGKVGPKTHAAVAATAAAAHRSRVAPT